MAVLPVLDADRWPGARSFAEWCRNYSAGMIRGDPAELMALSEQGGVWTWTEPETTHNKAFGFHLQMKAHMLHALEEQTGLSGQLWRQGMSLLDVGGGPGWLGAYLMGKHGMEVVVYEVPSTADCEAFLHSPFNVHFFTGSLPIAPRSFDAVSFVSILHHAAERTQSLLEQAAAIARRWIVVIEDLDVGSNRKQLQQHDGNGVFRSEQEWTALFASSCREFSLLRHGRVQKRGVPRRVKNNASGQSQAYVIGVQRATSYYQHVFVLERRG